MRAASIADGVLGDNVSAFAILRAKSKNPYEIGCVEDAKEILMVNSLQLKMLCSSVVCV